MGNKKPTDEEILEIIKQFQKGGYETDAKNSKMLHYIERTYSEISDLIFQDKRNLTPEEILAEAKEKSKPILL